MEQSRLGLKGHGIVARVKEGAQGINEKKMWLQD